MGWTSQLCILNMVGGDLMTRARFNGGYALLLGCMLFVICGIVLESNYSVLADFATLYFPTRNLLQHHDPYMQSEVLRLPSDVLSENSGQQSARSYRPSE